MGDGLPDEDGAAQGRYAPSIERLKEALASVGEGLDELALEVLRDAAEEGRAARPELERRLTRARNGVDRALGLLDGRGRSGLDA